jgi:heavy metal translocating P-type ATPase
VIDRFVSKLWLPMSLAGIVAGAAAYATGFRAVAHLAWGATAVFGIVPIALETIQQLLRRHFGVDVIAVLALSGSLILQEYLTGAVIALMLATGRTLEHFADSRAHRELSSLLERAPRTVSRYEDGRILQRAIDDVGLGDLLLVKTGEVVPVDGIILGPAVLDESALTGESRPVERSEGEQIRSGAVNAGVALDLRAVATAEESTYAGIVRLVREAEAQKAPFARLADRYAAIFVPVTIAIAGGAWLLSGQADRALAVVVVATPCPLLLAVPIAIVAGISRAAKRGIIVKGGGALEVLAQGRVLFFDKTGTLTAGSPEVSSVEAFGGVGPDEMLRLAASLDQVSPHVLATAIVAAAQQRGLSLTFPERVEEQHGAGIKGSVEGRVVALGKAAFAAPGGALPHRARDVRRRTAMEGSSCVFVSVDGEIAGAMVIDDPVRPDSPRVIRSLRRAGIRRVVMVTGDHPDVAESVGIALGVDRILSERDPADKVEAIRAERDVGTTIMVGDGINDAPALAAADVGVAMGARGATASSEAADVVLVVDRLDRIAEAMSIARRSRRIAVQSVLAGMGMSFVGMFLGAVGVLKPLAGAIVQEAIDVAVILNALRALAGERGATGRAGPGTPVGERFREEHREFGPQLARLRSVADRLGELSAEDLKRELLAVRWFLLERLPKHEEEEEAVVYPVVERLMGGEDPMAGMARAHLEIEHLSRVFGRLLDDLPEEGPAPDDILDLRRVLYGLHAILRLHFAQEEEAYAWLASEEDEPVSVP